jgi:peptidoglycan/LPS O-acetylase OafA/YrhL
MKSHGAVGVWLFFALSAFLLTLPFAARPERVSQPSQLRHYVARRLRRILPAYYFAIVVIALLSGASFTFLWQHFAFIRAAGILWTIPQEMLFYLCLPLLVARPALNRALDLAGLLILVFVVFSSPHYFESYLASIPRIGSLDPPLGLRYKHAYGVLCGAVIYVTMVCEGGLTHRIMSSLPLRALGVVSFSVYLFHVVVTNGVGVRILDLPLGNALFFTSLGATYVVACVVYSLVERPFMRVRSR